MMGASCPAPQGSRGDEGQLPMAPGRGLGLAAGRRRDRMTVSNLIRHKLHRLDELPRSHQHPASLQQRFPTSGMMSSGARSSAQAESGSVSAYSTRSLTRGKQCWGQRERPGVQRSTARMGTGSSTPQHPELERGKRPELQHSHCVSSAASSLEQSYGLDRIVTSSLGSPRAPGQVSLLLFQGQTYSKRGCLSSC